jgi:hypothetical protein
VAVKHVWKHRSPGAGTGSPPLSVSETILANRRRRRLGRRKERQMRTCASLAASATTIDLLPKQIDLGFVGTSALITATVALAIVWPLRLLFFVIGRTNRSVQFEAMATLSSGAAALGALLGLVFVVVGSLSS